MACCICRATSTSATPTRSQWKSSKSGYSNDWDFPIPMQRNPNMDDSHSKPTLLERLSAFIMREPEDREQLIELLHSSHERNLLDADALAMIEGVLQVSELQAR